MSRDLNSDLCVLFLHGWHSGPVGAKSSYLSQRGFHIVAPTLCPDSFEVALAAAQEAFDSAQVDVVVGSSRGGAVAMNIQSGQVPLVLVCPAWKHWGTVGRLKEGSSILHSPSDEIIPFEHSLELVAASGLPDSALIQVGSEHRMGCPEALKALEVACRQGGNERRQRR